MTKKDYEALVKSLAGSYAWHLDWAYQSSSEGNDPYDKGWFSGYRGAIDAVVEVLKKDNELFDEDRFKKAFQDHLLKKSKVAKAKAKEAEAKMKERDEREAKGKARTKNPSK